ncbi:arabinosylfuranosidase ArfA [Verminephrobacter aporrectodeae]|uniref:arabinosylfuranosidase ArfA n=1 Tax=Verminephrobacter aporrectodeae TaxID=1110389 RepID=UPI0002376158|nr:alpha-N-arabinofuranosidase [Verminephrobacter aporrectodeae]MCW5220978.1 alpha-N-arabinofuranosidase [Verminephrobacter aporrectodeae subsp. tuberculatae]MCW5258633.1 alpha-N-arabinofuranosidase [Verminephrobacter aporrectodeae subsp. tuberculatae]MCW5290271.1 alpha-N-arabinofuranosidase [Verminephrobacter aporrectodeae subsp. tuberculatae]MCW8166010.1 alpha-N-arabinofuranosidase [Verminephrobacter aporrectodeae subsp. tuberculatae]MCW8170656.1 alpha-N-arabinofuranosidase [Verminephrobacte
MISTRLIVDRDFTVSNLDRRIFGSFVEHMGRCVYTGIYEPGHPTADGQGFRRDVMALSRELGVSIVRYPGGNFLSGYNWEDGVGPKDQRPRRLDLAWFSTETNQFGTNEFLDWCRAVGTEPMISVNLGTRGPDEARHFLEYCNHPTGTRLSDLRREHGYEKPHDIKFWCLGNEMDGPWQIGQKTADEYGRIAKETAKLMRMVDPRVQLAACGSSTHDMPTFGSWEDTVLGHCFDEVDFISLHTYFENPHDSTAEFLGNIEQTELFIREVAAVADSVAARKHSTKRIMLSVDEWNVWYKARSIDHRRKPGWPEAPRLVEEVYNQEDALAVGGALIVMMNNADRVKTACLAQLANVIGPIMTEPGGAAWRQTIFHPFAQASRYARGRVLRPVIHSPAYQAKTFPEIAYLCASVVHDDETGQTAIFALNRHLSDTQEISIELRGLGDQQRLVDASELHHADMKASNTKAAPDNVAPQPNANVQIDGHRVTARLRPGSWNVIVTRNTKPA